MPMPCEIADDLRHVFGERTGLLSLRDIQVYLNAKTPESARRLVATLPFWGKGRGKRYAVIDVAERLAKQSNRR